MEKETEYQVPDYFDDAIPYSFQHQVQADLAFYEIQNLQKQLKGEDNMPVGLKSENKKIIEQLIFWVKHFIEHAGQLGHNTTNMQELLTKLESL